jgi:hypothetical protein
MPRPTDETRMNTEPTVDESAAKHDRVAPIEEYKCVHATMRQYATLRFYQLALLLGTTGSIITALTSQVLRQSPARIELLKGGALLVSLALLVMDLRASTYWQHMRDRANTLALALGYYAFPIASRWNPLTTSGAGFYLHATVVAFWLSSLFTPI